MFREGMQEKVRQLIILALCRLRPHKGGMKTYPGIFALFGSVCLIAGLARAAENEFIGSWGLTVPGGAAGWLGVQETDGKLKASLMWAAGSVDPLASAEIKDGKLVMTRNHSVERKDASGKKVKKSITETLTAHVDGDKIHIESVKPRENGNGEDKTELTG